MRFSRGIILFVSFFVLTILYVTTALAGDCDWCVCDRGTVKPSCTACCSQVKSDGISAAASEKVVNIASIGNSKFESLEKRLDAMGKTMENLLEIMGKWQAKEGCGTVGCNCRIVKTCVAVSCTKYDDQGKCTNQICVAWESKFVCD